MLTGRLVCRLPAEWWRDGDNFGAEALAVLGCTAWCGELIWICVFLKCCITIWFLEIQLGVRLSKSFSAGAAVKICMHSPPSASTLSKADERWTLPHQVDNSTAVSMGGRRARECAETTAYVVLLGGLRRLSQNRVITKWKCAASR